MGSHLRQIGIKDNEVKLPGLGKGQTFHRNIPHVAHKRIAIVTPTAHTIRLKQSAYLNEIDRIYHKVRPSLAYQPTEDYLNSRSIVSFDDETRSIRAKTAEILKRIHTPIPRAQRPMPLLGDAYYSHSELPITERISSDNYINRLLSANKEVQHNVLTMSHYDEPAKHYNHIGKGHLACVSFAGGRPISKRRNLASADDYIRDDIKVLSHYGRFRAAAEGVPHVPDTEYGAIPHRPPTKSTVTGSWKSNAPHRPDRPETTEKQEHHINANLTAGEEFDAALDRKKKRREAVEAAALREAEEEKRRKQELQRQEELAQQAAVERQEELERKAREEEERKIIEEEERIAREEAERLEAERKAREEEERKAQEEAERLAKEEADKKAKEEAKKAAKKKAEEERKRKEEEERKAKEEAERKAKEEEERKAKEEEERKAKEEAERKAKEEEERKAKEEAERKAKEEEERKAKEEAERLAKEEEERKAQEEAERLAEEERLAQEANADGAEESGPEPVVEEPQSPEEQPTENTEATAVEEVEEEEEEEE